MVNKTAKYKNLFLLLLIIASFFMSIGYASINSILLDINSTANVITKKRLQIIDIQTANENNSIGNISFFDRTYFYTTTTLSNNDGESSVTYSITISNNTPYRYGYIDAKYVLGEDSYDNENITFELSGLNTETVLQSGDVLTFNITFKYKDATNITNNVLNGGVNFIFKNLDAMQLSSLIELNESNLNESNLIEYNNKKYFVSNNVNNYIWFNCDEDYTSGYDHCERWRIVSIEPNEGVRIVKDDVVSFETITSLEEKTNFWLNNTGKWITDTKILAQGKVIYDTKDRRPVDPNLENAYC